MRANAMGSCPRNGEMCQCYGTALEVGPVRATVLEYSGYLLQRSSNTIRSTSSSVSTQALRARGVIVRCRANGARRAGMRVVCVDEDDQTGSNPLFVDPERDRRMHRRAAQIAGMR